MSSEAAAPTPYDQVPYPAGAYAQSHPDRLATLATLFGLSPPDVRCCRVLELACADGSNLIPMACAFPESRFVGIDLSARQIRAGQETIAALGLTNIELRHQDIRAVDAGLGTFDYIIAHGVYSWVPREVQDKLLRLCHDRLSGQGVAYVSYNTHPGWRMRGMLRDMMLYHSRKFDDPRQQIEQARALINWLADTVESAKNPYGLLLKTELEQMQRWQDTYFRHDSLAEVNEPVYFHQFIERAEAHGLQYLAESEFHTMLASNYASAIGETLNRLGRDIIEMEQYMDFLRNRMFRQTLLCRRSLKLNRALGPWSLEPLHVSAALQFDGGGLNLAPDVEQTFRSRGGSTIATSQPLIKAALRCLDVAWPAAVTIPELVVRARETLASNNAAQPGAEAEQDRRALCTSLLTIFTRGLCELHTQPGAFTLSPGAAPRACPLIRRQAAQGDVVTNRRHERVTLDNFARQILPLLDGTRDRRSLAESLAELAAAGRLSVTVNDQLLTDRQAIEAAIAGQLDTKLQFLARHALLIG